MRQKEYMRLTAFEIGQLRGALIGEAFKQLQPDLQYKFKRAQANIYLDSGFKPHQVFGDQRYPENKKLAIEVCKKRGINR